MERGCCSPAAFYPRASALPCPHLWFKFPQGQGLALGRRQHFGVLKARHAAPWGTVGLAGKPKP